MAISTQDTLRQRLDDYRRNRTPDNREAWHAAYAEVRREREERLFILALLYRQETPTGRTELTAHPAD